MYEIDVPLLPPPPKKRKASSPPPKSRPQPCEPLNANWRLHWRAEAERVAIVRARVKHAAQEAGIPVSKHLTVQLHYAPGDNRPRDADNLWPVVKAAADALARNGRGIGLDLVPDDTPKYMNKLTPHIHPGPGTRRLWLTVEVTTL